MAFGSEQWMYSAGGFYPHEIDNSVRFNDGDSAYLVRTPSSAGNRKTFTWSGWVKRSTLTDWYALFVARNGSSGSQYSIFSFRNTDVIQFVTSSGASVQSTAVFRDASSWYHFTLKVDTTQSTASDRVKIYANGVEVALAGTYPTLNADTDINNTIGQYVGWNPSSNPTFNGYMAEINFVDGQALDPTDFGETKSGVWIPKEYEGTYGTNGFHLDFSDSTRTRETDTALVTAPYGGNAEFARVEDGLAVISNTTTGQAFTLVQYDLGSAKEVKYYIIEDLYFTGNVSTFQLQYSNDNSSWTSAVSFAITNNVQDFAAALSITARYWRIRATAFGTNGSARIDCLQLFTGQVAVDTSGNGNNLSSINVLPSDVMSDSPTNNFATLNPLIATHTYSQGNLSVSKSSSIWSTALASTGVSSGKWYVEYRIDTKGWQMFGLTQVYGALGINPFTAHVGAGVGGKGVGYVFDPSDTRGDITYNGSNLAYTSGASGSAVGDVIGIAVDLDNGNFKAYRNGSVTYDLNGILEIGAEYLFGYSTYQAAAATANFGQDSSFAGQKTRQGNTDANDLGDFYYAPPAGYLALCSANLPDTAIDPAKDDIPADYFNPVLYTGNGSTQSITGTGFQPDWVWIKERSSTSSHSIFDQVRGPQKYLASNSTSVEGTSSSQLTSFDADGFTTGASGGTNQSGQTYVAWNWKAGGTAVANTDGTIASQVSANQKAGFSIVTYTGTGSAGMTIGHGLSSAPELIIVKNRDDGSENWTVYSSSLGNTKKLELNLTLALATTGNWNNTSPSSSVFTLGSVAATNSSGDSCVAYCFHSVEGFSKFGSYTGNGSTDGPFVYTGFRPAYVMIKRSDTTGQWSTWDAERNTYNVAGTNLWADSTEAEYTSGSGYGIDLTSNGFKLRNTHATRNASGGTYIYMAFAEMPFKYANAR